MTTSVIIEGFVVGLVVLATSIVFRWFLKMTTVKVHEYIIVILIGAVTHLLFEVAGFNKWYCKNGTACK